MYESSVAISKRDTGRALLQLFLSSAVTKLAINNVIKINLI